MFECGLIEAGMGVATVARRMRPSVRCYQSVKGGIGIQGKRETTPARSEWSGDGSRRNTSGRCNAWVSRRGLDLRSVKGRSRCVTGSHFYREDDVIRSYGAEISNFGQRKVIFCLNFKLQSGLGHNIFRPGN
ncbi:D-inositol 3-phosphate glycosyltransferase [Sesbania bispinosa]|nr:D-inositol 3-phosphate glycosyltransferase [Sesbania bispinosa]